MQKQKTIAKWLSVILLTTVAIGCYVALSSVDKTTTNTASGAEENQTLIQQPQITYSTLPRKGECVNSALVSHFGGSKDDYALDYAFFANKMLVFAKSESIDKDVEKQGLHIAVFCENVLEKSIFLGDENTEYICSSLTKNGILIFTKSDEEVRVILLKEDMSIGGKTSIKNCDKIVPISQGDDTLLLCLASNELYVCTIAKTLDVISDNFVYQTNGVTYVNCYAYADNLNVFIQDDVGIKILQYNVQSGFRVRYSLDKHSLLQVIPLVASNEQHFIVLSECDDVAYLNSFDASINHLAKQSIKNARHVVALADENGIKAVSTTRLLTIARTSISYQEKTFNCP